MARTTYQAPGVYVEEIPSARQPIAGVGTNTVGFIGAVPDTIWCPIPNPQYDPVMAQMLLEHSQSGATSSTDALRARQATLQTRINDLTPQVETAQTAKNAADAAVTAAEGTQQQGASADAEAAARAAAGSAAHALPGLRRDAHEKSEALEHLQEELDGLKTDLQRINDQLNPQPPQPPQPTDTTARRLPRSDRPAAGPPPSPPLGETDDDYRCTDPSDDLRRPSIFRPYYLEDFTVTAAEFDTKLCTNFSEYSARFGDFSAFNDTDPNEVDPCKRFQPYCRGHHLLTHAVAGFFANGGTKCFVARVKPENIRLLKEQVLDNQFESIEDVSILAAPGLPKTQDIWEDIQTYCESDHHQNVFAILDSPLLVEDDRHVLDVNKLDPDWSPKQDDKDQLKKLPRKSAHAAFYFPHIEVVDPAKRLQDSDPAWGVESRYRGHVYVAPSGHVAGIYARTDEERGVHKAPANAIVRGALEVKYYISRPKQELLNPRGVNCIRLMNGDLTVWGARNIGGDSLGEWKYVSVRRFAGFLEESIKRGTQWVVFEPNDPNLWSRIILNITAFLTIVWRNGALFGLTAQEAFYVKCDEELNPPEVRDLGQVIIEIGVAIVRPAEFVIFRIQQRTGQ